MADAPWRCSECGTINEPVANACRTCGRWPSLFDLEQSAVDEAEPADLRMPGLESFEPEPGTFEPEAFEPDTESSAEPQPAPEGAGRRRLIARLAVPLAFVVYLVISIVFGER